MNQLAPIVLFMYRRPEHLSRTIESLMGCELFDESHLIVYADGAKGVDDRPEVEAARRVAKKLLGDRAEFYFSERNKGLANSVIEGVNDTLERFGKIIVIEDDLILASGFLRFMNEALSRYANNERIYQVSGYGYNLGESSKGRPVFLPITSSWGWGTWKRAWEAFDPAAGGWEVLLEDPGVRRAFDLGGVYGYTAMLFRQITGKVDSWAIRWYWSVFQRGGLVLYPPRSLVDNLGFDGSGSHGRGTLKNFSTVLDGQTSWEWPSSIEIDENVYQRVRLGIRKRNGGIVGRARDLIATRRLMGEVRNVLV